MASEIMERIKHAKSVAILGVGNDMRGDDAAGVMIARKLMGLEHKGIYAFDCGTVPESFVYKVLDLTPDIVLIVDAADMGLSPGEIRIVPEDSMVIDMVSTHSLPIRFLMVFLKKNGLYPVFMGIQPENLDFGASMSRPVENAVYSLCEAIKCKSLSSIEIL